MARKTLKDVAERAGVGVATVDRVLNARAPVSSETTARVLAAAEVLGYRSRGLLRRRVEEMAPAKRLGFVLQKQGKWYYQELAREISEHADNLRTIRASVDVIFVDNLSPTELAEAIDRLVITSDTIGIVAVDHPLVDAAVARANIPVFALLSPISSQKLAGYIGIDGRKAGRTAGWAMSRLVHGEGEVGILIGSHRYLGHEALEIGFRSYMRENAPRLSMRDSLIYLDDTAVAYEATADLLRRSPDLVGLYHCGGGVRGAVAALEEAGKARDIFYICHEETPTSTAALTSGTVDLVVSNPVAKVADQVTRMMARCITGHEIRPGDGVLPFQILTSENI